MPSVCGACERVDRASWLGFANRPSAIVHCHFIAYAEVLGSGPFSCGCPPRKASAGCLQIRRELARRIVEAAFRDHRVDIEMDRGKSKVLPPPVRRSGSDRATGTLDPDFSNLIGPVPLLVGWEYAQLADPETRV